MTTSAALAAPLLGDDQLDWIHPRATVVEHSASQPRTWGSHDLAELVQRRAMDWAALGLATGDRVIVATGSRLGTLLDVCAAWGLGLCPVLLSDSLAAESYRLLSRHVRAAAVRATPAVARSWSGLPVKPIGDPAPDGVMLDLRPAIRPAGTQLDLPSKWHPDDPLLVLASSGSTGLPKAVVHRRSSLLANAAMHWQSVGKPSAEDRYLLSQSMHFSSAFVCGVLGVLNIGMQLVLLEPPLSPPAWAEATRRYAITHVALTPHMLTRVLTERALLPASTRHVTIGGDRLGRAAAESLRLAGISEVFATYGLTEAGPRVASNQIRDDPAEWGSLGTPLPGVALRLAEREKGPAELIVNTHTALIGTYADGAFIPWLYGAEVPTGDLAETTADGGLRLVGRARRVASISGEKVYLGLVERVLSEHPAVLAVRVEVGASGRLTARILPHGAMPVDATELRRWCRGKLRSIEVPREFITVTANTHLTK